MQYLRERKHKVKIRWLKVVFFWWCQVTNRLWVDFIKKNLSWKDSCSKASSRPKLLQTKNDTENDSIRKASKQNFSTSFKPKSLLKFTFQKRGETFWTWLRTSDWGSENKRFNDTYSLSRLCLYVSTYRNLRFRLMSVVSFSRRLFENSDGSSIAVSIGR